MKTRPLLPLLISLLISLLVTGQARGHSCDPIAVTVLGSGGPEINDQRAGSSYAITLDGEAKLLLDTGSGSHNNFERANFDFSQIAGILLSHLHTDHSADLPAYIKGSFFTDRTADLPILGPSGNHLVPSTREFVQRLFGREGAFSYLHNYLTPGAESYLLRAFNGPARARKESDNHTLGAFEVRAKAISHGPIPALAWRIDIGKCRIVYLGDTNEEVGELARFAKKADLLIIHNAIPEHAGRVAKNLHITPGQISTIVTKSRAKRVLVSHFMNRTKSDIANLAEALQKNTQAEIYMAEELLTVTLEMP